MMPVDLQKPLLLFSLFFFFFNFNFNSCQEVLHDLPTSSRRDKRGIKLRTRLRWRKRTDSCQAVFAKYTIRPLAEGGVEGGMLK